MRLTMMTDYALRMLMFVGSTPDRLATIAEVAAAHRISQAHLTKVAHQLGLGGFLHTVRGRGGGIRLARPASQIVLGEVVRHMESDLAVVECLGSRSRCVLTGRCRLTQVLQRATDRFLAELDARTLDELLPGAAGMPVGGTPVALPARIVGDGR
ncbi:MAG: Rrf2 family transcriptional regulator [Burkholderiaceae bacterium]